MKRSYLRIGCLLLALVMLLSTIPAFAAEEERADIPAAELPAEEAETAPAEATAAAPEEPEADPAALPAPAADPDATTISSVTITLDAPAVGAHPDYTAVFPSGAHYYSDDYESGYLRNDIAWWDETAGYYLDQDTGVFQAGHVYSVTVYLTAQSGYAFTDSTTATVNGQSAEASEYGSQLRVVYTFPPLPEEGIVATGILDSGVYWKLDNQGTLTYFGSGEVNASLTRAEMNYRSLKDVIIEGGITKYDVIYDDNDYDIPESITAKGHLTDFDVESEYHYGYHIGSSRLSNIYFQGAAPDSIRYSSSAEVTIWYDPDMPGWTQELIDQLSQDPNITVKATGSPVITSCGDEGYGEGSPAVTFSVAAEGKGTLSYQWFTRESAASIWNEVTAASGKTADYTFTPSRELELYCRVSNTLGSVDSPVMYLRKVIFSQPADQTADPGEEVSFSVQAGGMNGISYQWYYLEPGSSEWVEVNENGTSNTLTLTAYERFNGRQYRCRVYGSTVDSSGCWHSYPAYSRAATLTVISASAPVITTQPKNSTGIDGKNVQFKVVASGSGLSYQWQYKKPSGSWTNLTSFTGHDTDTLTVPVTEARNGYQYRCKVTGGGTTVTSSAATLTVFAITAQPANKTASAGENVQFSVTARGSGVTYQWQYLKPGGSWTNCGSFAGYNTKTLTVPATTARNGYQFRCKATCQGTTITSSAATLTVGSAAPYITTQPGSKTGVVGKNVQFTVAASGSSLTYQWQYLKPSGSWTNCGSFSGYNTKTMTVPVTEARNGYKFRCVVSSGSQSVTSSAATLTVFAITAQPANVTAAAGTDATFTVTVRGSGVTYQWQYLKPGGSWTNCGSFSGYNTKTMTVPVTTARNGYKFRCKVTCQSTTITSSAATLTVGAALSITSQPSSKTGVVGKNVQFKVVLSSTAGVTYQWQYLKPSGSWTNCGSFTGYNTATVTVPVTAARNGYKFRCVVTKGSTTLTSNAATLTVFAITAQPQNKTASAGTNATFTVTARGSGVTYQWQYKKPSGSWTNCGSFTGYNTKTLTVPVTTARNGYQFRCLVTCQGTTITSNAATLTVG